VLSHLKDNHSHLVPAAETLAEARFDSTNPVPSGFLFHGKVGVIEIPEHDGDGKLGDGRNYATVVQNLLYDLEQQGATVWVIDLRNNFLSWVAQLHTHLGSQLAIRPIN
jgi:hypothetical protein